MTVFVDTSAVYALLDRDDDNHHRAAAAFDRLLENDDLVTHSYCVVESCALVQRRLGTDAVRALADDLLPAFSTHFVEPGLHAAALSALLAGGRRDVSLVDWTSFELMRRNGIETAFAFDDDFERHGFRTTG